MGTYWTIGPEGRARMKAAAKLRGNNQASSSPEARQKLRAHMLRRRASGELVCHGHSAETRALISSKMMGRKLSAETIRKMSATRKLRPLKKHDPEFLFLTKGAWSRAAKRAYGEACQRCGWNEAFCDAHHKIPRSQGGKNIISNAIILCPNCHRVTHLQKEKK
jgi:predicted restriction endonuclease